LKFTKALPPSRSDEEFAHFDKILQANQAAARLCFRDRYELEGQRLERIALRKDRDKLWMLLQSEYSSKGIYSAFDLNVQVESTTGGAGITGKSKTKHPSVPSGLLFLDTQVKNALNLFRSSTSDHQAAGVIEHQPQLSIQVAPTPGPGDFRQTAQA
jgi:hypothetical protein